MPIDTFVDSAIENKASLICMSSFDVHEFMYGMKDVIDRLSQKGYRDKVKIMVGGGPITNKFAYR